MALALLAIVAAFGAASALALYGLAEVHDAFHESGENAAGVATAQALASSVRDQYAHQAHTIVLGNDTHLGAYEGARQRVAELVAEARRRAEDREERAWLDQIERESAELDQLFKAQIVPAVLARDEERIIGLHDRAQVLVTSIQDRADRLARRLGQAAELAERRAHELEHRVGRWVALLLLGATLLAAGIGAWLHRSVLGPIRVLEVGAARIGAGDLLTPIGLDGDDELAELGRRFEAMTQALREHQAQRVASERLAGIGRLAAGVAHEINNPLTVILGYTRLLMKRASPGDQADLQVITDEARRCQEIVASLLELARPEAGGRGPVPLRSAFESLGVRLEEAGLLGPGRLVIQGDGVVWAHEGRLRQVLFNLLKNAAEAGGREQEVVARIEARGPRVQVDLEDRGPGLPAEAEGRLFEPFFTTKDRGTGLGLAVSKAIVEAHGGTIAVERARPGLVLRLSWPAKEEARG